MGKSFKSMTGYGRSTLTERGLQVTAEIMAVNRKHLDIVVNLPGYLTALDPEIRKKVSQKVFRGHVTVKISAIFQDESPLSIKPNLALVKELYKGWCEIGKVTSQDVLNNFDLRLLEKESHLFSYEEKEGVLSQAKDLILSAIEKSLTQFLNMRNKEGAALEKDIISRIEIIKQNLEEVKKHTLNASLRLKEKFLEKIKNLLPTIDLSDERLLKEIAIMAEKVDIEEEIVRFESHVEQFIKLIQSDQEAVGKTIEFLLQELSREINTIGSKTSDYAVSHLVIAVKSELERIREQIQNIE